MSESPLPGQPADPNQAQQYPPAGQQYPPAGQAYPAPGQPYPQQYPGQPATLQYGAPQGGQSNGMAIGALISGIAAIVLCFIPFVGIVSVLIGAVAIVLGVLAKRKAPEVGGRGLATAGIITGAIGAFLAVVWLILTIAIFNAADDASDEWNDEVNEQLDQINDDLQQQLDDAANS